MAKRNSDGEVLANKFAVGLAKFQQHQFAALFGDSTPVEAQSPDETSVEQANIADLKGDGHDEGFGLGAMVPKEVQDGSFTNRIPTSHEKLLENLIGKKAAKAHLASKQKHTAAVKPQKPARPTPAQEESDEEEGRASTFKSKRQRRTKPAPVKQEQSDDEDEESRASSLQSQKQKTTEASPDVVEDVTMTIGSDEEPAVESIQEKDSPKSEPSKSRPKSYLDEVLSQKNKKKKNKKKGKGKIAKTDE